MSRFSLVGNFIKIVLSNGKSLLFITLVLSVLGYLSVASMKQTVFPAVSFPRATIKVDFGFAPLEGMQTRFVLPIEKMVASTPGVVHYTTKIRRGSAEISVLFDANTAYKSAFQELASKVASISAGATRKLKITTRLLNTSSFAILGYSLSSGRAGYQTLFAVVKNKIEPALTALPSVAGVEVIGGLSPEIKVVLDPAKLAQFNLSPTAVARQLSAANRTRFAGSLVEYGRLVLGFSNLPLRSIYDINVLPIRSGARMVQLGQLADVYMGTTRIAQLTSTDRQKSVLFNVLKTPDADVISVTREVNRVLAQQSSGLPPDFQIKNWYALADFITTSVGKVLQNIYIGIVIVSLSILLYLRRISAALPILLSMLASILISFIAIRALGYSVNIMTLAGVSAAVGILVDNASVVVENIDRRFLAGEGRRAAVIKGTNEVIGALVFSTLTTVAVFAPLGFLSGVSGFLFRASSVVIVIALLVSLVLSLTLAPLLSNVTLGWRKQPEKMAVPGRMMRAYKTLLHLSMKAPWLIVLMAVLLAGGAAISVRDIATSYLPVWDEGTFIMDLDTPAGTSLAEMGRIIDGVEGVIAATPQIQSYSRIIGDSIIRTNEAHFFMHPRPRNANGSAASVFQVMDTLESNLVAKYPDINIDLHQILPDRFDNFSGQQDKIVVEVTGNSLNELKRSVASLKTAFLALGEVKKVKVKEPEYQREFSIITNAAKLAGLGLARADVLEQIEIALNGTVVNQISRGKQSTDIRLQYPKIWQNFRPVIADLPIFAANGKSVPLRALARVVMVKSPDILYRQDGRLILRMKVKMTGNNLGANAQKIQAAINTTQISGATRVALAGDWQAQERTFRELRNVLTSALFLVFTLLLIAFRSYGYALLVMINTSVSLSFIVFGLIVSNTIFNVSTFMGVIAAVGIVVNNAILVISFLQQNLTRNSDAKSAMIKACEVRVRPILITSTTTVLGFLPMALSSGRGGEMLQPFAIAIIFGILGAVISSLFVLPNIYAFAVGLRPRSQGFRAEKTGA